MQQEIKKMPLIDVDSVASDLVKIKGKLTPLDKYITAPLSEVMCIGYEYTISQRGYEKRDGRYKKIGTFEKKWKVTNSETKCSDFFLSDETGKIKVIAKDISIFIFSNETQKNDKYTLYSENILIPDKEYFVIGSAVYNTDNELIITKQNPQNQLLIIDTEFYDIAFNTSRLYKIGCTFVLLSMIILLILILFY